MKNNGERLHRLLAETREKIEAALADQGVVILPPLDVHVSARLLALLGYKRYRRHDYGSTDGWTDNQRSACLVMAIVGGDAQTAGKLENYWRRSWCALA